MLFVIELVFPEKTKIRVSLVAILTVEVFEDMGQGSSCLVSNLEELVLLLPLQHYAKYWWCSDLCGLLYLIYFDP